MSVLSKILNDDWSTPYNCYELGHVWDPDCYSNALYFGLTVFMRSCQLYTPLYVGTHIIFTRKYDQKSILATVHSIVRSSAFISSHLFWFFALFCGSRALLGKFYYRVHAFPVTFLISLLSLPIEKKSRQGPLAVYVANIASECMFKILSDKGYIYKVPKGEVLIFTASMAALLYYIKQDGYGSDPVSFVLKLVLGTSEAKKRISKRKMKEIAEKDALAITDGKSSGNGNGQAAVVDGHVSKGSNGARPKDRNANIVTKPAIKSTTANLLDKPAMNMIRKYVSTEKHASCVHADPCLEYAATGFARPFLAAYLGSTFFSLAKKAPKIIDDPLKVITDTILRDRTSLRFGLFIGSFAGIYKAVNCYLRWRCDGSEQWHAAVGGLLAGPTMFLNPNSRIATYFFWKLVETIFVKLVKVGHIKNPNLIIHLVYSASVSLIGYCILFTPKYMRPSYMKLADTVCDSKLHLMNRCLITFLFPDAIEGYEDYFANLEPNLMTDKFKETVFTWLLECKEYDQKYIK